MHKVLVRLMYWAPNSTEEPVELSRLAEVICTDAEQAHAVGDYLCDIFARSACREAHVSVNYDIV
jgi:hypothetical protein